MTYQQHGGLVLEHVNGYCPLNPLSVWTLLTGKAYNPPPVVLDCSLKKFLVYVRDWLAFVNQIPTFIHFDEDWFKKILLFGLFTQETLLP